jgi:hypothetical protein
VQSWNATKAMAKGALSQINYRKGKDTGDQSNFCACRLDPPPALHLSLFAHRGLDRIARRLLTLLRTQLRRRCLTV